MEEYHRVFYLLSVCFSGFSLCCAVVVSLVVGFSRLGREDEFRAFVACLVADGILLAGVALDSGNEVQCQVQGLLVNWGNLAMLTYAGIFMYLQYVKIVWDARVSLRYLGAVGVGMTGLVAGLEYSMDFYKKSSIFCAVSTDSNEFSVVILAFFSPIVFAAFFCLCVSVKVESFVKECGCGIRDEEITEKFDNFSGFKRYSWCIILINCGFAVYTCFYWVNQEKNVFVDAVGLVALGLSGYFVSLVFLFNVFGAKHKMSRISALVHPNLSVQDSE